MNNLDEVTSTHFTTMYYNIGPASVVMTRYKTPEERSEALTTFFADAYDEFNDGRKDIQATFIADGPEGHPCVKLTGSREAMEVLKKSGAFPTLQPFRGFSEKERMDKKVQTMFPPDIASKPVDIRKMNRFGESMGDSIITDKVTSAIADAYRSMTEKTEDEQK